jgi:hypothetical protein
LNMRLESCIFWWVVCTGGSNIHCKTHFQFACFTLILYLEHVTSNFQYWNSFVNFQPIFYGEISKDSLWECASFDGRSQNFKHLNLNLEMLASFALTCRTTTIVKSSNLSEFPLDFASKRMTTLVF